MKKKQLNKVIFGIIGTVVLSMLFAWIIQKNWFLTWHLKSSNFLYYQGQNEALDDIVIIAIDDKSFELRNASELGTLQFSKADYARVIENLEQAGAKVIGVDIILSEISPEADRDVLARALKKYNNVILAAEPKTKQTVGLKPRPEFIAPHPENLGAILFTPDRDNTVRRQALFFEDPDTSSAFAVQIIKRYLDLLPEDSKIIGKNYELMPFPIRVNNKKYAPIAIPLNADREMMINFFGRPYSFQAISFADAYENQFKEIDLSGKIVLIGEMGTGLHDEQYVPISFGSAMPGVEIHANSIQTILSQRFLVNQSKPSMMLVAFVTIAIGLTVFLILNIVFSIIAFFAGVIIYMITTWIAFEYGMILNTVYPHLALLTAFITAYIYRYFTESRAVIKTEKAFSHYVSGTVVKKILEDPDKLKLGGVKKELTVFFSDIANFTKISEKLKAENLVKQLNSYLDAMGEVILNREGTLDKFIGDAIVAFWGAPIPQKDHAVRACLSALEYQEKLKNMRSVWEKHNKLPFYARIGINTGEMVVGNMGSNKRFDYTVIGDAANLGSRLEGANKFYGTEILISDSTYNAVKHKIEAREIDVIKVKGKTKIVRVYELLAKKGKLSYAQVGTIEHFKEGLKAYRQQYWGEAIRQFKEVLKLNPKDEPSKVFIKRCEKLVNKKLPKDWDGVFELTGK